MRTCNWNNQTRILWFKNWRGSVSLLQIFHILYLPVCLITRREAAGGDRHRQALPLRLSEGVHIFYLRIESLAENQTTYSRPNWCHNLGLCYRSSLESPPIRRVSYSWVVNKQQESADSVAFIKFPAWCCVEPKNASWGVVDRDCVIFHTLMLKSHSSWK